MKLLTVGERCALRRTYLLLLVVVLARGLSAQESAGSGNFSFRPPPRDGAVIHGIVINPAGNPVFGVDVISSRIDAPSPATSLTVARATSRLDGNFSLTGLNPGTYRLCVDPMGKEFLDPCEWSESPVTVQVEENGVVQNLEVFLEAAEMVTLEVDDQADTLGKLTDRSVGSETQSKPEGILILGLRTRTGNLSRARIATANKQTKKLRYIVPAPKDEDLEVMLMPVGVDVKDQADRAMPERGALLRISKEAKAEKPSGEAVIAVTLARKGQ